jgi:hypothetical protein
MLGARRVQQSEAGGVGPESVRMKLAERLADVLADKEGAMYLHRVSGRSLNGTTRGHTPETYTCYTRGALEAFGDGRRLWRRRKLESAQ